MRFNVFLPESKLLLLYDFVSFHTYFIRSFKKYNNIMIGHKINDDDLRTAHLDCDDGAM